MRNAEVIRQWQILKDIEASRTGVTIHDLAEHAGVTTRTIRRDLQDAFLKQGFGVGRTFTGIAPTLRIDYILATDDFSVNQFNRIVKNYADHYMLVADFKIKK